MNLIFSGPLDSSSHMFEELDQSFASKPFDESDSNIVESEKTLSLSLGDESPDNWDTRGFSVSAYILFSTDFSETNEDALYSHITFSELEISTFLWLEYLAKLRAPKGRFSSEHIDYVIELWNQLAILSHSKIGPPQSGPTVDEALHLVWDRGEHHLEMEVYPQQFEWFYSNRAAGSFDGKEGCSHITDDLKAYVELMFLVRE